MDHQPIDPLIKKQYDNQLAEEAAKKAKALMEQPEQHLAVQPDHELVEFYTKTFFWQQGPGKINRFTGEGDNAIFRDREIEEIKKLENNTFNEAVGSADKLIKNIPKGKELEPFDEWKFKRDLRGDKPTDVPYDQDNEVQKIA